MSVKRFYGAIPQRLHSNQKAIGKPNGKRLKCDAKRFRSTSAVCAAIEQQLKNDSTAIKYDSAGIPQ
jgi:hypothetical protein